MSKKIISTKEAPAAIGPYSQAVQMGDFLFCSGQIPIDPATGDTLKGSIVEQTELVIQNIRGLLKAAGLGLDHVVKSTIFLTDMNDFAKVNETYAKHFTANPPARSTIQVAALPKAVNVEIEVIAHR